MEKVTNKRGIVRKNPVLLDLSQWLRTQGGLYIYIADAETHLHGCGDGRAWVHFLALPTERAHGQ